MENRCSCMVGDDKMAKPKMNRKLLDNSRGLLSVGHWALEDKEDATKKQKFFDAVSAAEGIFDGIFNYADDEPSGEIDHAVIELRNDWQRYDELNSDPQIEEIQNIDEEDRTEEQQILLSEYLDLKTRFGLPE